MTSKIPNVIKFQVYADDKPVEGVICMLTAETNYKNSFNSVVGPSDKNGHLIVTKENILTNANEDAKLFLMDYGNPTECITGNFTIVPMTISKLNGAKETYNSFRTVYQYSQNYLASIERAILLLSKNSYSKLTVKVISVEGVGKIKTVTEQLNNRAG